jgi:hypothetical protein
MESAPQVDPPGVQELPKERPAILAQIPEGSISFSGQRMPIDMNSIDNFMPLLIAPAPGAQYRHFVVALLEGVGLLPNTLIEGNR